MPQSTLTYILSHIINSIPPQILDMAFRPTQFNTTVEQRILKEVIEGPVLLDTNLIGGLRRDLYIDQAWELGLPYAESMGIVGPGVQSSFYKIPPEWREHRNIASVIGVSNSLNATQDLNGMYNGSGGFGNNATGMLSQLLNTRTMASYPPASLVELVGTNVISFTPRQMISGTAVTVMLEYDSEFLNMGKSAIWAMRDFCLCATMRYIAVNLRVPVDETQIVAGMEIGVIKDIIVEYTQKAEEYKDLLIKVKGAQHFNQKTLTKLIYYSI